MNFPISASPILRFELKRKRKEKKTLNTKKLIGKPPNNYAAEAPLLRKLMAIEIMETLLSKHYFGYKKVIKTTTKTTNEMLNLAKANLELYAPYDSANGPKTQTPELQVG